MLYGGAQRFFRRHGLGPTVLAYLELRTWRFEANGELWNGAVSVLENPGRPGSFVFQSCAPHVEGEGLARGALLEMMD